MTGISIETAARVGDEAPAEIPQQDFMLHMAAMQQHYCTINAAGAQPVVSYTLPAHINLLVLRPPNVLIAKPQIQEALKIQAVPAGKPVQGEPVQVSQLMGGILHDQLQQTLAFINAHRDAMLQVIASAQGAKDTQAFQQQMDALRDRAKADHDARINAMFARLVALGTAHSAARPVILGTGNKVGEFVAGITAAAANVAGSVKSAVAAGGTAVGKAAETVGTWASGAAQSVGHFFSSIF